VSDANRKAWDALHRKRLAYVNTFNAQVTRRFTRWQMLRFLLRTLTSRASAYEVTFLGGNGKPHPEAERVLEDLRKFCGMEKGGIVVSPVTRSTDPYATVYRAALRDVYLRITGFINFEEKKHDGRSTAVRQQSAAAE
jgi:hypothetical protein